MRVVAAMSGGVDSSVAAARLIEAGHEVVGVHLALARKPESSRQGSRGCCTLDDARDARRVADMLGIPFYVWDFAERFADDVIEDFFAEYEAGRTPNPCLRCNERIKFAAVLDRAVALGFDAVATGHYAQRIDGPDGAELHRAVDPAKDQSYVLGVLEQWQLERSLFPLGGNVKADIRAEAERLGLLTAQKPDSHDICFIPDGDTAAFLGRRLGERPGDIIDIETGDVLGTHSGAYAFTIGQRRGLGLGNPGGGGEPRYVVDVALDTRQVFVGGPERLDVLGIEAIRPTWTTRPLGAEPVAVMAQVRAHATPVPAMAHLLDERIHVALLEPIRGLAAGQAVVLYDGDRVIGSGTVDRTHKRA